MGKWLIASCHAYVLKVTKDLAETTGTYWIIVHAHVLHEEKIGTSISSMLTGLLKANGVAAG